jgi:hypothetical protein
MLCCLLRLGNQARLVGCHRVGKWALPFITTNPQKKSIRRPSHDVQRVSSKGKRPWPGAVLPCLHGARCHDREDCITTLVKCEQDLGKRGCGTVNKVCTFGSHYPLILFHFSTLKIRYPLLCCTVNMQIMLNFSATTELLSNVIFLNIIFRTWSLHSFIQTLTYRIRLNSVTLYISS